MILVAKNADFSANKIGNVDIPLPMLEETEAILANFAVAPSQSIINALNAYVYALIELDIYDKIKYLSFPCLAGSVSEAIKNVLTGNSWLKLDDSSDATTTNLSLSDKSIKVVPNANVVRLNIESQSLSDISIGIFLDKASNSKNEVLIGNSLNAWFDRVNEHPTDSAIYSLNPSYSLHSWGPGQEKKRFVGFSAINGNLYGYIASENLKTGTFTTNSNEVTWFLLGLRTGETYTDGASYNYARSGYQMIYLGDGLTETEFVKMKEVTTEFMAVVNS